MKDCDKFQADLTDYARGEYKYIKDFGALFNHLRECETCREKFFDLEALFKALRPPYKPSPQFLKRMEELKEMFKKGPPPAQEIKDERQKMIAKGIELYKKQKWFEAAKVFDQLVQQLEVESREDRVARQDPSLPATHYSLLADAYYHRGLAHQRMNSLDEAIVDFTKAIELDKDDTDAYFHRAEIYLHQKELDKGLSDLNRAIRLNPDYTEAYYLRGLITAWQGDYQTALNEYNKAIELQPFFKEAYFQRGYIYGEAGQLAQSIADFTEVIKLTPNDALAYYNRGVAYARKDALKQALSDFKKSLELEPDFPFARYNLVRAEGQLLTQRIERQLKQSEKRIAKKYQADKKRLKTKYEAEIRQWSARVKTLEEMNKQLIEALTKTKTEYTYQGRMETALPHFAGLPIARVAPLSEVRPKEVIKAIHQNENQ